MAVSGTVLHTALDLFSYLIVVASGTQQRPEIKNAVIIETGFQHSCWRDAHFVAAATEMPGVAFNNTDFSLVARQRINPGS